MKKRFWSIFLALFLSLCFVVPAMAESQDMWAYVYKDTGKMGADGRAILERITSGITFVVRSVDSDVDETLTYYGKSTSLTNPVTTASFESATICNDRVAFRVDPTDTTNDRYVNLIVVDTNGGFTKTIEDFDKYQHSIVIDEKPNVMHHGIAWFSHASSSATPIDTGINFLPKTLIHDVRVEVITADSGITINVGTADTAAGFRSAVSLTSTGFVADTGVITGGSIIDYTPASTYGTLLYTAITGSDAVATVGGRSYLGHAVNTSGTDDDLYFTGSTGWDTAHGFIHFWFTPMRIP